MKLWLIEVNMSPACAERQPWLTEMLDDMADGVSALIQAKVNGKSDLGKAVIGTQWEPLKFSDTFIVSQPGDSEQT